MLVKTSTGVSASEVEINSPNTIPSGILQHQIVPRNSHLKSAPISITEDTS